MVKKKERPEVSRAARNPTATVNYSWLSTLKFKTFGGGGNAAAGFGVQFNVNTTLTLSAKLALVAKELLPAG